MIIRIALGLALLAWHAPLMADQFHYNNIIMGDRAIGLGGAYTAIADDASGVVYNPAGFAFSLSNDISGSANAFYGKKTVYKKALGSKDFEEKSRGSMAPFFGGLQKLDHFVPGLVFAFGIGTIDSDLKDQDDLEAGITFTQTGLSNGEIVKQTKELDRLHRAVTVRASTNLFGIAVAKRFTNTMSFGFGLNYIMIEELVQEYQDIQYGDAGDPNRTQVVQNVRELLEGTAIEPTLGFQWAFANSWSFGAMIKYPISITQKYKNSVEYYNYDWQHQCLYKDGDNPQQVATSGKTCEQAVADGEVPAGATQKTLQNANLINRDTFATKIDKPFGTFPPEARMGVAWFASPRFLAAFDVIHKMAAKKGDYVRLEREAVTNFALGLEYFMTPSVPVRWGFFTNYDSRPELDEDKQGQSDHIDYYGTSLFFAWVQPNSQVGLGTVLQSGTGKAQKAGGYLIQDVESFAYTIAFSATHNF